MTDKELKEWEEEAEEAEQDIKHIFRMIIISVIIGFILFSLTGCGTSKCPNDNGWRFSKTNII